MYTKDNTREWENNTVRVNDYTALAGLINRCKRDKPEQRPKLKQLGGEISDVFIVELCK